MRTGRTLAVLSYALVLCISNSLHARGELCLNDYSGTPAQVTDATGYKASSPVFLYVPGSMVSIPDTSFLFALIDAGVDTNSDSLISIQEAFDVEELVIRNPLGYEYITSIEGIGAFQNLRTLSCVSLAMDTLDLSVLDSLEEFHSGFNQIEVLTFSNPELSVLHIEGEYYLKSLNLVSCPNLQEFIMGQGYGQLRSLDLNSCSNLRKLSIIDDYEGNLDLTIDVSECDRLEEVYLIHARVSQLDLSHKYHLRRVTVTGMSVYMCNLDVSYCPQLEYLDVMTAQAFMDISHSPNLGNPDIEGSRLSFSCNAAPMELCVWADFPFWEYNPGPYCGDISISKNCGGNPLQIPDTAFLKALIDQGVDMDSNGAISYIEAASTNQLDVSGDKLQPGHIMDLTGLEHFLNLEYLNCAHNQLNSIDLTSLYSLKELECGGNPILDLDLSNNHHLNELDLQDMPDLQDVCTWTFPFPPSDVNVTTTNSPQVNFSVDCGLNDSIVSFSDTALVAALLENSVDRNGDSLISFSEARSLSSLDIQNRGISRLDGLEAFIFLDSLNCSQNTITHFDFSRIKGLSHLWCDRNQFSSMGLSKNRELIELDCSNNPLESIPFKQNLRIERLGISNIGSAASDGFTTYWLAYLPNLTHLVCSSNDFELDLWANRKLKYLDCSRVGPGPTGDRLRLNYNSELEYLDCHYTNFKLDVSNNPSLRYIDYSERYDRILGDETQYYSGYEIVGLEKLSELEYLDVSTCYIDSLDIKNNSNLKTLNCSNNEISNLDVRGNPQLNNLTADSTLISSLDLSGNPALDTLELRYNPQLEGVCVWTLPFPPALLHLDTTGSSNAYFKSDCFLMNEYAISVIHEQISEKQQAILPISLSELSPSEHISAYLFEVGFDHTKLQYADADLSGTIAEGGTVEVNTSVAGKLFINYSSPTPFEGAGEILILKFNPLSAGTTEVAISNAYLNNTAVEDLSNASVLIKALTPPPVVSDAEACAKQGTPSLNASGANIRWYATSEEVNLLTDSRDNNTYRTAHIGEQIWMAENLNHGTRIPSGIEPDNGGFVQKYCLDDSESKCYTYGGLYSWDEMMAYSTTPGTQGICPSGWHLPTDEEWKQLEMHLGMSQADADIQGSRGTDQGAQLQVNGSSGFEALMGGKRTPQGATAEEGAYTSFWTSTDHFSRTLSASYSEVWRGATDNKLNGFSVRCVKDDPGIVATGNTFTPPFTQPGTYTYYATQTIEGVESEKVEVTLTIHEQPTVQLVRDSFDCELESIELDARHGFAAYDWSTGQTTQKIQVQTTGTYAVVVTDNNGCTATGEISVNIFPVPELSIQGEAILCEGDSTRLDAGEGFASYEWSNGQDGQAILVNETGTYSIAVTDDNGCEGRDEFSVEFIDCSTNYKPVIKDMEFYLEENPSEGTPVGVLQASDENPEQILSFSIISGNVGEAFKLNPLEGKLSVANPGPINYEVHSQIILSVMVQDNGEGLLSDTAVISINIMDVNDQPVIEPQSFQIDENAPMGSSVGIVAFSDEDPGQTYRFAIQMGNSSEVFSIDESSGHLLVNNPSYLDYEKRPEFKLIVEVVDDGTPPMTGKGEIEILLNDLVETGVPTASITPSRIYPNPTSGTFFFEPGEEIRPGSHMKILDINGRLVQKMRITDLRLDLDGSMEIQLPGNGVYFLTYQTPSGVQYIKVLCY